MNEGKVSLLPKLFSFSIIQLEIEDKKIKKLLRLMENDTVVPKENHKDFLSLLAEEISKLIWQQINWPVKPEIIKEGQLSQDPKDKDIFTIVFQE